jgi:hypothetical protein
MKYMITVSEFYGEIYRSIAITADGKEVTSFPAVVGNPNYDQFLVQAELTDEQVHALKPDVWYDFPQEAK